jgi:hypothetical protein
LLRLSVELGDDELPAKHAALGIELSDSELLPAQAPVSGLPEPMTIGSLLLEVTCAFPLDEDDEALPPK